MYKKKTTSDYRGMRDEYTLIISVAKLMSH